MIYNPVVPPSLEPIPIELAEHSSSTGDDEPIIIDRKQPTLLGFGNGEVGSFCETFDEEPSKPPNRVSVVITVAW